MKTAFEEYNQIVASIPKEVHAEVDMEMAVSDRIYDLMKAKGLSKADFARAVGKRPQASAVRHQKSPIKSSPCSSALRCQWFSIIKTWFFKWFSINKHGLSNGSQWFRMV